MAIVETEKQGDVAVISMNNPPVNALGHALRTGLEAAFAEANADPAVQAIVLTGTGRFFSAGADITEFASGMKEPFLPQVIDRIEASPKPVVAAVNGTALGGGLELALGCHYRVAAKDVRQLGLPEIKLGIIPGAGGTQRLPRVIGVPKALELILSGTFIDAKTGAAAGLIDKVAEGDLVPEAVAFARQQIGKAPRRVGELAIDKAAVPAGLFEKARASIARHPSGPLAPKCAIDAVELALTLPVSEGIARERQIFREAAASPYAKALQYAFFAERQAANLPGIGPDVKTRPVETVGIIGAGTMGTGITLAFLNAGIPVTLVETTQDALDAGVTRIKDTLSANAKRGRITEAQAADRLARLTPSVELESLGKSELDHRGGVREHGAEEGDLRQARRHRQEGRHHRHQHLDAGRGSDRRRHEAAAGRARPAFLLASQHHAATGDRARREDRQRRDGNRHGAGQAHRQGRRAGRRVRRLRRQPHAGGLRRGGAGHAAGGRHADPGGRGAGGMGHGDGAARRADLAGLDVSYRIRKERKLTGERAQLARVPDKIVEMGRHGQKTGAGFYKYDANRKRQPIPRSRR